MQPRQQRRRVKWITRPPKPPQPDGQPPMPLSKKRKPTTFSLTEIRAKRMQTYGAQWEKAATQLSSPERAVVSDILQNLSCMQKIIPPDSKCRCCGGEHGHGLGQLMQILAECGDSYSCQPFWQVLNRVLEMKTICSMNLEELHAQGFQPVWLRKQVFVDWHDFEHFDVYTRAFHHAVDRQIYIDFTRHLSLADLRCREPCSLCIEQSTSSLVSPCYHQQLVTKPPDVLRRCWWNEQQQQPMHDAIVLMDWFIARQSEPDKCNPFRTNVGWFLNPDLQSSSILPTGVQLCHTTCNKEDPFLSSHDNFDSRGNAYFGLTFRLPMSLSVETVRKTYSEIYIHPIVHLLEIMPIVPLAELIHAYAFFGMYSSFHHSKCAGPELIGFGQLMV